MGCQAVTPHLVGLARRLEGKPFHLIAAHNQNGTKDEVVGYIRSKGLAPDSPNMTVTKAGRHPGVSGNGYVPYYLVFDHTGRLAHHHMCGDYHGGDGLAMIEWVDKLLARTPAIYLGDVPFVHEAKLAEQVAKKKGLKAALGNVDRALERTDSTEEHRRELERLRAAIVDYRDRMIKSALEKMATHPSEILPALKDLQREFSGTSVVGPVSAHLKELSASKELKASIAVEKTFDKIVRSLEKRAPCKACKRMGHEGLNVDCAACREASASGIRRAIKKLDALVAENEALPIAATVKQYAERWRG